MCHRNKALSGITQPPFFRNLIWSGKGKEKNSEMAQFLRFKDRKLVGPDSSMMDLENRRELSREELEEMLRQLYQGVAGTGGSE